MSTEHFEILVPAEIYAKVRLRQDADDDYQHLTKSYINGMEEKMESKILLRYTHCAECGHKMRVIIGTGKPGFYNLNITKSIMKQCEPKGSYQCSKCKRYYCWACSDSRKTCKCGNQNWSEVMYIDSNINPDLAFEIYYGLKSAPHAALLRVILTSKYFNKPFTKIVFAPCL